MKFFQLRIIVPFHLLRCRQRIVQLPLKQFFRLAAHSNSPIPFVANLGRLHLKRPKPVLQSCNFLLQLPKLCLRFFLLLPAATLVHPVELSHLIDFAVEVFLHLPQSAITVSLQLPSMLGVRLLGSLQ